MGRYARDEIAPALNSLGNLFGELGEERRKNILFQQGQEDRAEEKQYKSDVNSNLQALRTGPQPEVLGDVQGYSVPGKMQPVALSGTQLSQTQAKKVYSEDLASDTAISASKDLAAIKELSNVFTSRKNFNLPENLKGKYSPVVVAQAQAAAANLMTQSADGKMAFYKKRMEETNQEYGMFEDYKKNIAIANQTGDRKGAATMISELSEKLSLPYKYVYNPGTDSFDEYYSHSGSGQFERQNHSVSFQEAMKNINEMTPEKFVMASYQFKEATRKWNEEARKPVDDPSKNGRGQYLKNNGKEFYVFPQKPIVGTGPSHYIVMDDQNNETIFNSIAALHNAGFRYEDLKREKALGDLALNAQQLKNAKKDAAYKDQQLKNAKNTTGTTLDIGKKKLDLYNKQFNAYLEPFGGGGIQTDENGNISMESLFNRAGKNSFDESLKFLEEHKDDSQSLTGRDKLKYASAKKAVNLFNLMLNDFQQEEKPIPDIMAVSHKPQEKVYTQEEAQRKGVRQLADGRFVIPSGIKGKGKVIKVAAQKESHSAIGNNYGKRADGTNKGPGFLGEIKNPNGSVSTELSIGVKLNGKETEIPLLIPTLTPEEIKVVLSVKDPKQVPRTIVEKAVEFAKQRIAQGLSPFTQGDEQTKWEETILGKVEGALINAPKAWKQMEAANEESYNNLLPKKTTDSSIPGINSFKR